MAINSIQSAKDFIGPKRIKLRKILIPDDMIENILSNQSDSKAL